MRTGTEVKIFRWNPTVGSYVLWQVQAAQKAGERTGVARFQTRHINTATTVGWECRITATDEGFRWIAERISGLLVSENLPSAAPYDLTRNEGLAR